MTNEEAFIEFRKKAVKIKTACTNTSVRSCENGKCKFYGKEKCIFAEMGMNFPFEWDTSRRRKSE